LGLAVGGLGLLLAVACDDRAVRVGHYRSPRPHFGEPVAISELNVPEGRDEDVSLTADELEIFFMSERAGGRDLWTATRPSLDAAWSAPTAVTELNTVHSEGTPAISGDGLRLWYYEGRDPEGLWYAERASRSAPWGVGAPVPELESTTRIFGPSLDSTETLMALAQFGEGTDFWDLALSERPFSSGVWGSPLPLQELNSPARDLDPFLYDGGLQLLFSSDRQGAGDLFWSGRESLGQPFSEPEPIEELNWPDTNEEDPHLSTDGRRLYFASTRSGVSDLFEVELLDE